jgi:uncharacterized protein YegP (UPF0339 family)
MPWKFEVYPRLRREVPLAGLVASNGQTVGSSGESFASKSNATEAGENVKANAGGASVEDADS